MAEEKKETYEINSTQNHHLKNVEIDPKHKTITYIFIPTENSTKDWKEITDHAQRLFGALAETGERVEVFDASTGTVQIRYTFKDKPAILFSWERVKNYISYASYDFTLLEKGIPPLLASTESGNREEGARSDLHRTLNGITGDSIQYDDQTYHLCSQKLNFAKLPNQYIASMGTDREVILLDTQNRYLQLTYRDFFTWCNYALKPDQTDFFNQATIFSNNQFRKTDIDDLVKKNVVPIFTGTQSLQLPLVSLADFVQNGVGVCRHHALLMAYLLGEYVRTRQLIDELKDVEVMHWRDSWETKNNEGVTEKVAHSWAVWKETDKLYIVDAMWKRTIDITSEKGYQEACQYYTASVVDKIRLNASRPNAPQKEEISPPPHHVPQKEINKAELELASANEKIKTLEQKNEQLKQQNAEVIKEKAGLQQDFDKRKTELRQVFDQEKREVCSTSKRKRSAARTLSESTGRKSSPSRGLSENTGRKNKASRESSESTERKHKASTDSSESTSRKKEP